MSAPTCRRARCGQPVNPSTWPGDEGYCTALHLAFDEIEAQPCDDPWERQREEYAARLRSPEFLARSLGLVLGERP